MALSEKHKRIVIELLDSGKLNDWEKEALGDINSRDDQGNLHRVTPKMEGMIERMKKQYIDGEDTRNMKAPEVRTVYDNCQLLRESTGYFIEVKGLRMSEITSKKEGVVIIEWLDRALKELEQAIVGSTPSPAMTEEDVFGDPDNEPF